jgi:hypothetical protein
MKTRSGKRLLISGCVLCVILTFKTVSDSDGTEYMGGLISGPLLALLSWGSLLFVIAIAVAAIRLRAGAAIALTASTLCLPLYLFENLPTSFLDRVLPYPHKVAHGFGSNGWSFAGLFAIGVLMYLSGRLVLSRECQAVQSTVTIRLPS